MTEEFTRQEKSLPVFRILWRNIIMIICVTIVCGIFGTGIGLKFSKTTYTASCNVMFSLEVDGSNEIQALTYSTSVAKAYVSTVAKISVSQAVVDKANIMYKKDVEEGVHVGSGTITSSNLDVDYENNCLIYTLSYSDPNRLQSYYKLETVINAARDYIKNNEGTDADNTSYFKFINAKNIDIRQTQKITIDKSTNLSTFIIVGFAGGLVISVLIAFLIYLLDNKIKDMYELEEISGTTLLAIIHKQ